MPHRTVKFAPEKYYHVYNRGAGRQPIFREAANYIFVLRKVKQYAHQYHVTAVAYCLMPNHYHFLIRQDGETAAGLVFQHTFNSYTKAFNKRYDRSGTLFEERFQVIHVDRDEYLLHLCRYIHGNPVKAGLVQSPEDWAYSNYPDWIGLRTGDLVDREFVQAHFPNHADYRQFVMNYLTDLEPLPQGVDAYLEKCR